MKRFYIAIMAMMMTLSLFSQTTLVNPATEGGFENGSTFAANGWTTANSTTDSWVISGNASVTNGSNAAHISSTPSGAMDWTYSQVSTIQHMYRDIVIPVGEPKVTLTFKWKALGEGTTTSDWDNMKVFFGVATSMGTPVANTAISSTYQISGPGAVNGMYKLNSASYNNETISIIGTPGSTYRLCFSWKSDITDIVNPPIAMDEISLVSAPAGNFVSAATGDWNVGATWVGGIAPSSADNVTITTGHTVTINASSLGCVNLQINGTLNYGATPSSFNVLGNLVVNSGAIFNVFNGTTGKTLNLTGNLTNAGTIDLSLTSSLLTLNGNSPQTVSGAGTFVSNTIRSLTFNNTSTTYPSIIWGVNSIMIPGTHTFTNGRVAISGNWLTCGTASAVGTLTYTAGGILSGTYGRGQTTATTGSLITAGSDPTTTTTRFPFINTQGLNRSAWFERTGPTGAGIIGITYVETSGSTSVSIADANPVYTVDNRANESWTPSVLSGTPTATSFELAVVAPNIFGGTIAIYPRLVQASGVVATNQAGTTTPCAQRGGLTLTELTSAAFYFGINNVDVPNVSATSGDWNNPSTWSKGAVPSCSENVSILNTHTVTINSVSNNAKSVTINTGGTLNMASGSITVGCTDNNNLFSIAGGTFNMQGGTLTINGKMQLTATVSGIFTQSGGNIIVDGNSGTLATSTPGHVVDFYCHTTSTLQLTGGTFTVVDPALSATSTDRSFKVFPTIAHSSGPGWTLKFGDGVSTQAGGHIDGFEIDVTNTNSFKIGGTVIVDVLTGTNRYVTTNLAVPLNNLTINSGEYRILSTNYISGNIVNNGTLTTTSTLVLSDFSGTTGVVGTSAQTISGAGVFRNATSAPTGSLVNLTINNNNATGITLQVPLTVSSTFTMTSGLVNTTSSNILQLGTGASGGTLSGTPSATNMIVGPFARNFPSSRTAIGTYSNTTLFPIGKVGSYTPIHVDPTTNAGGPVIFSSELFTTNSGTAAAGLTNLSSNRWEALIISGLANFVSTNIRLNDASLIMDDKIVQSSSSAGVYGAIIPVSTFAAGSPNTLTTTGTQILAADYAGYISSAELQVCSGTPDAGVASPSNGTRCSGQTYTMSATGLTPGTGISYQWKVSTTSGSGYVNVTGGTGATTASYTTATLMAGTYYFVIETTCVNGGGTNNSNEIVLVVNQTPSATPSSNSPVCEGATLNLLGNTDLGVSFTWTGPNAFSSNVQNPMINNMQINAVGSYTFTATSSAGCSASGNTSVSVNLKPVIAVTATPASICIGDNSQLLANVTNSSYSFTPSSGTYTALTGATDVDNIEADDSISQVIPIGFNFVLNGNTYSNLYASSNGWISFNSNARSTSAANARNNSLTSPPSTLIPLIAPLWDDLDGSVVPGSARYLLSGTSPNQVFTFEWLNWEWNWQATSGVISYQVKLYEIDNKIEFIYQQESGTLSSPGASIGMSLSAGNFLSLNNTTASPTASSSSETTTLATKPANGQVYSFSPPSFTYAWFPSTFLSNPSISNPVATNVTSTTKYYVTVTNASSCSKLDSVTVTASAGPAISNDPSSVNACLGKNATFTIVATGANLTYAWEESTNGGGSWSPISNGGIYSGVATASLVLSGVTNTQNGYKYRCVVSSSCGSPITSNGNATLIVNPNPTASMSPTGQSEICAPGTILLTASSDIGNAYQWKRNNVNISGANAITYNADLSGIYSVVISVNATGCKDSTIVNDTINVKAPPSGVTATASSNSICEGASINLFGNATISGSGTIGAGLSTEFANSPYRNGANSSRQQYLFTAAELNSIGYTAGNLNSIQFFVTSIGSPVDVDNYTIQMAHTSISNFGSSFETPAFTTVFNQATYTVLNGNNTHVFSTPFAWNGTDNIIIQICHEVTAPFGSSTVKADAVSGKSIGHIEFVAGSICNSNLTVTTGNRPNITFNYGSNVTFAWSSSPMGFTSNSQNPINVMPTQNVTYILSATGDNGCTATATTSVNITGDMVMNGNNTGAESLRKVIECANVTDTIYFDAGVTTVTLTDSILLNKNLLIIDNNAPNVNLDFNLSGLNFGVKVPAANDVQLENINVREIGNNGASVKPLILNQGDLILKNASALKVTTNPGEDSPLVKSEAGSTMGVEGSVGVKKN